MKESGVLNLASRYTLLFAQMVAMLVLTFSLLSACAATPDADKVLDNPPSTGPAKVIGPRGPLTAEESREMLKDIGATDALRRHLKIEQAIAESPLVEGNSTRLLRDGKQAFPAIFAAIEGGEAPHQP